MILCTGPLVSFHLSTGCSVDCFQIFISCNEETLEELIQTQLLGDLLDDLTQEPILTLEIPEIDLGALTPIVPPGTMISPVAEAHRLGGERWRSPSAASRSCSGHVDASANVGTE